MQMQKTVIDCGFTILASRDYQSRPITVAGSVPVPAGSPMTSAGVTAATESQAVGILLHDVDPNVNPNGALLVQGLVNARVARTHSGATLDAATLKVACPGIVLVEDAPLR